MKKLLSLLLALTLALSLSLPAFALEDDQDPAWDWEDDTTEEVVPTDYDLGWEAGYQDAYDRWYATGYEDGVKLTPQDLPEGEYTWGETYDDGYADGTFDGQVFGYMEGYFAATGRDSSYDRDILAKNGTPGQVNVMANGQCVAFPDAAPQIVNSRTMIPVRAVMETLDAQVSYDKAGKVVLISKDNTTVSFVIGSTAMCIMQDGDELATEQMDCAPYIENDRTMVPLRFLSQAFGYTVLWDNDYRTAVVVDAAALIAETDSRFTHLNDILASNLALQAGKKFQQSDTLTGTLTLYDEDGKAVKCPFSAASTAYTDGRSSRIDLTVNAKEALTALLQCYPDLTEGMDLDLSALLRTDFTKVTATVLLTEEGTLYIQMPLLNDLLGLADRNTWVKLSDTGADLSADSLTIGQLVVPALLVDEGSFYYEDTVDQSLALLEALYGDEAAQVRGDTVTWALTGQDLVGDLDEDAAGAFDTFSLTTTLGKDGSYQLKGSWKADLMITDLAMAVNASGTLSGGSGTFSLSMSDLFALDLTLKTTVKTVSTLPDLTLPAGAVVEELAIG